MPITVNGRIYEIPRRPIAIVCVDGFALEYLQVAIESCRVPYLTSLADQELVFRAIGAMPSFTNPNNVSIVTGVSPAIHGIAGNYFLDPNTGREVMMNEPEFLRCGTIFSALGSEGKRIAAITAKDKLRTILAHGLPMSSHGHSCFSIEKIGEAGLEENGLEDALTLIPREPEDFYSTATSMTVLDAGIALLEQDRADILYLSTTDYIQHMHGPDEQKALDFMSALDERIQKLDSLGCDIVVTADHGMNAKTLSDKVPNVLYVQSLLEATQPQAGCRVILPVTDPYVIHHGSLGSYATVYLDDPSTMGVVCKVLLEQPEVEEVVSREKAASRFELPVDRIGDVCVLAAKHAVLGKRPEDHDLSQLTRPLRSHGGLHEQVVPLITNRKPLPSISTEGLRNFDALYLACNGFGNNSHNGENG